MSNYIIIYGYDDNIFNFINETDKIILIEPRKNILDSLHKTPIVNYKNIIVIRKALLNVVKHNILYINKDNNNCTINDNIEESFDEKSLNYNYKKESIFGTSLKNILSDHEIININLLIINIHISNIFNVLASIVNYNQIISKIMIKSNIYSDFFSSNNTNTNTNLVFKENLFLNFVNQNITEAYNYSYFNHKNIDIPLPKICMYLQNLNTNDIIETKIKLFTKQYNIDIFDKIEPMIFAKKSKIITYEWILNVLEHFFNCEKNQDYKHDIFFIFNSNYFNSHDTFPIIYPIENDILYVNKENDIIYASKSCMFMLYEILKSDYFNEYINTIKQKRKTTFYLFAKKAFYDYLEKIFMIKNI